MKLSELLHPHVELGYYHKDLHPLRDFAEACRAGISHRCRMQVLIDVAAALSYIHSKGFFHQQVCAKNVILFAERRLVYYRDPEICASWGHWEEFTYTPRLAEFDRTTCNDEPRASLLFPFTDTPERLDCYSFGLMTARAFAEGPVDLAQLFCRPLEYVAAHDMPYMARTIIRCAFHHKSSMREIHDLVTSSCATARVA